MSSYAAKCKKGGGSIDHDQYNWVCTSKIKRLVMLKPPNKILKLSVTNQITSSFHRKTMTLITTQERNQALIYQTYQQEMFKRNLIQEI